jgi:1,4-dihydroxy-2-naphthoate octaprenyltransferase
MNQVRIWTQATRPKTLIISISPVMIGMALAITEGVFDFAIFLFTLATAMTIQIGTNLANDYFDYIKGADTSERKGPQRITQSGLVSPIAVKWATMIAFILAAVCGCYLIWHGGMAIGFLLAISILLGVLYTGGPFPLAYLGLGELFAFAFFGPIATAGTYYMQTHHWSAEAFLAGVAPGALATAVLIINNVRDIEEDSKVGKKTLVVRFGKTFGKIEYLTAIFLALIPLVYFTQSHFLSILALLILLPAIPLMRVMIQNRNSIELNALFGKTAQLIWLYTLLFCIGWML